MDTQNPIQVRMKRDHLDDIPEHPTPAPFQARLYQPGDVTTWLDIHHQAKTHQHLSEARFWEIFNDDESSLRARQLFLCDEQGIGVGTATAWFDSDQPDPPLGRIHWVAIVPQLQGRGLGRALLSQVCLRLRELGHRRTYLNTETFRIPAIRLYLKFGFRPEIRNEADLKNWRANGRWPVADSR